MEVTLRKLRQYQACYFGYNTLVAHVTGQEQEQVYGYYVDTPEDWENRPIPLLTVLKSNDLDDTMWATRALDRAHDRDLRLLAREFALLCRSECLPEQLDLFDEAMQMAKDAAEGLIDLDSGTALQLIDKLYTEALRRRYLASHPLAAARAIIKQRPYAAAWEVPVFVMSVLDKSLAEAKMVDLCVQTFTGQSWWQR